MNVLKPLFIIFLLDFFEPCSTMSVPFVFLLAFLSCLANLWDIIFIHQVRNCSKHGDYKAWLFFSSIIGSYCFPFGCVLLIRAWSIGRWARMNGLTRMCLLAFFRFFAFRVEHWMSLVMDKSLISSRMTPVRLKWQSELSITSGYSFSTPRLVLHSQLGLFLSGWSYRHYWHGAFLLLLCQICFDDRDQLYDRALHRSLSHRSLLNLFSVSSYWQSLPGKSLFDV